jgi:hypothetical protein
MLKFLMILALLAGCGSSEPTTMSGINMAMASCPKNTTTEAAGSCYTTWGVYAELGTNPCNATTEAWNPVTNKCIALGHTEGEYINCDSSVQTGSLKSGDMVVATDSPYYVYWFSGSTAGVVCLPCIDPVAGEGGYDYNGTPVLCATYSPPYNQP